MTTTTESKFLTVQRAVSFKGDSIKKH